MVTLPWWDTPRAGRIPPSVSGPRGPSWRTVAMTSFFSVTAPSDVEPVVAGRDAAAGLTVAELGHQAPAVLQGAVGVQRSHSPS